MKLRKSFQLALNILLHSKLRSWLTIIGIVIGVAAIVAIVSIGEGAQANLQARLGGLGADIITVSPGFSRAEGSRGFGGGGFGGGGGSTSQNLTERDITTIKNVDGVLFVNGIVSGRADVEYLAQTATLSVQGVDPFAWRNIITTELDSGRYLDPGDSNVVVIGNRVATTTFKQPIPLNRVIVINNRTFKVVGILKTSDGIGGSDNAIYMPAQTARTVLKDSGRRDADNRKVDSITVKVSDPALATHIADDIDQKLMLARHVNNRTKDYSVTSAQATQERLASVTSTFTIFLGAIAAVSLLVGAVGIANTMFTSVLEKTKEIGILKAIGAKNSDIMTVFMLNSALVGFVGGALGVVLGALVSYALPNFISLGVAPGGRLTTVLPPKLLIGALTLSVAIGMAAGAIPAYRASRLKPVEALRYE